MRWIRVEVGLLLLPLVAATALAQGALSRITGSVTSGAGGEPVSAASVIITGTQKGARTDNDGKYLILGVAPGTYHLKAMRVGFEPMEQVVTVAADAPLTVNFAMKMTSRVLSSVVVVGYGTQKRSDLTGSVSSVTPKSDQVPMLSMEQALQGAVPGLSVTSASSAPGGGMSIRVRGGASVTGNNEPLYVIDGFPIDNDPEGTNPSDGGRDATVTVPSNPLAALDPANIASIEVLKDASATAIYGARGANGVIMITTKGGVVGRPVFTLDSYTGSQQVAHRYKLLNATQFAQFVNTWSVNNGTGTVYADPTSFGAGTDWQDVIFRTAPTHNLQLGVSGGTTGVNTTRYALSGGLYEQTGVVLGSGFRRVSFRGSLDQSVGTKLHVVGNLSLSRAGSNSIPTDGSLNAGAGAVGAAIQYYPTIPLRRADGSYTLMTSDGGPSPLTPTNIPNPLSMANDVRDQLGDTRYLANTSLEYEILKGLKLKVGLGSDLADRTRDTYYPRTTLQGAQVNGQAIRGRTQSTNFLNENTLAYRRAIGLDHQLDVLVGYTRQSNNLVATGIRNSNFVSDISSFESIGAGTQTGGPTVSSGHTRWTLASYIGRVNYTFKDRYLFSATARRDGSSRFGADNQWGEFPAFAFAWRVSEEPFMQRFGSLDELKLRLSTGVAGNPSIRPYQSMAHLNQQQTTFNGTVVPGYYPSSIGDPNLSWESTRQTDAGVDFGLWKGRLSVTADLYRKKTSNLLLAVNLPYEAGFATALQNSGSVQNNGYEIGATFTILRGEERSLGIKWTTTVNYSQNRNKVLDLGGPTDIFASSVNSDLKLLGSLIRVGEPLGVFYGYKTAGLFRDSASAIAYTALVKPISGQTWRPGDIRLVDVNGDGAITATDRTIIGDPNPKFTGGWQNSVSWKAFRVTSSMDASVGGKILNLNNVRLEQGSPGTNILADRYLDAWTLQNPNAKYPRVNFTPGTIGSDITDDLLEDGSFYRLRAITLEYTLPADFVAHSSLRSARVYVTGSNLWTQTKYSGFNPDVSSLGIGNVNRGIDVGAYPLAKSVTFGVNLTY